MRQRISTRFLLWAGFLASLSESFVVLPRCAEFLTTTTLKQTSDDESSEESSSVKDSSSEIPLLPHFGISSQSTFNPFDGTLPHLQPQQDDEDDAALKKYVANRKFELQYTCNVCETRNRNKVSRIAYRKGVVISTCKGCGTQHLIADNLGFTNLWDENEGNIEKYFKSKGMEDSVNRVSKDVFDLENMLSHDSESGSILGEDGKPALE